MVLHGQRNVEVGEREHDCNPFIGSQRIGDRVQLGPVAYLSLVSQITIGDDRRGNRLDNESRTSAACQDCLPQDEADLWG